MKKLAALLMALTMCLAALTACEGYDDSGAGAFFTGAAGNGSTIFSVGLSVSPDGGQCVFAYGVPGNGRVVLGQIADNGDGSISIYPIDGGAAIDIWVEDNSDGSVSIMFNNYEGSMDEVSEQEFMALTDMLG
jgi:hypothetical protein